MAHGTVVLFSLFISFLAAKIGGEVAERLKLPSVVGEIAAGCIVGPHAFALIETSEAMDVLAEIGAVLLLFAVGLETKLGDLKRVGKVALAVGSAGVMVPFAFGLSWAILSNYEVSRAAFIGAAFVATSAGITARVLQELHVLDRLESRIILGAAVIDDILAMLLLGVVSSFYAKGALDILSISLVGLQAVLFVLLTAIVGTRVMQRSSQVLDLPIDPLSPLTLSLAGCLGLAFASAYIGLAAIIGAFLAGMVVAESRQRSELEHQLRPLLAFLVPFFFVVTGAKVDLSQLMVLKVLLTVVLVSALAIVSKVIGCGAGAFTLGKRSALIVGVGMVPRGEVGIIVASLGLENRVFSSDLYTVIIAMSLVTSVIAPPLLKALYAHRAEELAEA